MKTRKLSAIEFTVLGLTWQHGPCTTYSLMKGLANAGSTYFRNRAGTTYSVTKRLVEFGYLQSGEDDMIAITEDGRAVLCQWLEDPVPISEVAYTVDLIRLRTYFLGILPGEDRLKFVDESLKGLREVRAHCLVLFKKSEEASDYFGALAMLAAIKETDARIEWVTAVRRWVESPLESGTSWSVLLESMGID
jgi:DNA-binding PadR family transcriptional regulator